MGVGPVGYRYIAERVSSAEPSGIDQWQEIRLGLSSQESMVAPVPAGSPCKHSDSIGGLVMRVELGGIAADEPSGTGQWLEIKGPNLGPQAIVGHLAFGVYFRGYKILPRPCTWQQRPLHESGWQHASAQLEGLASSTNTAVGVSN